MKTEIRPSDEKAKSMFNDLFIDFKDGVGEITIREVKDKCENYPYPWNLWFC